MADCSDVCERQGRAGGDEGLSGKRTQSRKIKIIKNKETVTAVGAVPPGPSNPVQVQPW